MNRDAADDQNIELHDELLMMSNARLNQMNEQKYKAQMLVQSHEQVMDDVNDKIKFLEDYL